jgi:outer membrane protein insertion porin family
MKLIRSNIIAFLFVLFSAFSTFAETYPAFNFSDWPEDFKKQLFTIAPELQNLKFTELELNGLLKRLSENLNFTQLSIAEKNGQLFLIGSINSTIQSIDLRNVTSIPSDEAKEILSLQLDEANIESKVNLQIEKLLNEYRNRGFRKSTATFSYENLQTGQRRLIIQINEGPRTKITSTRIMGLEPELNDSVNRTLFWKFSGRPLTDENIKTINAYLRLEMNRRGFYLTSIPQPQIRLNTTDEEARLSYSLEKTQAFEVQVEGQKHFSKLYLLNDVLQLDQFSTTEVNVGSELTEKLKAFYLENGFSEFNSTYIENKINNKIIVTIILTEGPLVRINDVRFQGQFSKAERNYVSLFYELSSQQTQDKIFIKSDVELAVQNVMTYLQNEGFVLAKLNRIIYQIDRSQPDKVDLLINIDEGPQLEIEKISIEGNHYFNSEAIQSMLRIKIGSKISLSQFESNLIALKNTYMDRGFLEMHFKNDQIGQFNQTHKNSLLTYSQDLQKISIHIKIEEGPQIRVNSITLIGNTLSHNKLILTELDFKKGDILTPQKIDESVSRLQKTGHFSTIDITTLEANSDITERSVIVKLTERQPGILTTGIGVTNENDYTFHGYLGVAYRNIGGWGRGLSLRGEGSYNPSQLKFFEYKATIGYLEPYLFDTRARFRINYTTSRYVSDINIRKQTIANTATWAIEQDFTSHITGIWDIFSVSNFVDAGITADDEVKYDYSRQDLVIASTGPTIDFDYRDNVLNPQRGSLSRLSLEFAASALGSNNVDNFIRANAQSTFYNPVLLRRGVPVFVWANSFRAGYIKDLDDRNQGIPFDKRGFALGGRSTIRGFPTKDIFPSSLTLGPNYRLLATSSYQLIKSEFRLPLFSKQDISIGIFYDGGQVLIENFDLGDTWRDSVGVGFRYNTPVGPLNLEYAKKLDRKDTEDEGAFHLSVGVF